MRIISNTLDFELEGKSAVALGKFDGIHKGHIKLLERISEQKKRGMQTVIFTFDPSPQVLFGTGDVRSLMTREEKRTMFEKMGIDVLFEFPLNYETAAYEPEAFIREILVEKLHAGYIAAGTDLSYGDCGKGDAKLLLSKASMYGYEVDIIEKVMVGDEVVSSTLVRTEIEKGNMERATMLLGHPYCVGGIVEPGKKLGRTLDFPTLNLFPGQDKMLPPGGVYCSKVEYLGEVYPGITNIGYRPTVSNNGIVSVETYVFDFEMDLYGKEILVQLLTHTRPEKRFENVEQLKAQLEKDKEFGLRYFANERLV